MSVRLRLGEEPQRRHGQRLRDPGDVDKTHVALATLDAADYTDGAAAAARAAGVALGEVLVMREDVERLGS